MEIKFHSPRGIRCVINAGWEDLEKHLHSQRTPKALLKPGCFILAHSQKLLLHAAASMDSIADL